MAEELVRHSHLNPASRYPRIFLEAARKANDSTLRLLACSALAYAALRLAEAYGLWHHRRWAVWLGVVTGGIYIPIELDELMRGVTWPKAILLCVNTACVVYLALAVRSHDDGRMG
jgi:uncharacterized membrane protein (DUF2068 family)